MKSLTREIVFDQVLNLLTVWWELGYRNLPHSYYDIIKHLFPGYNWGQSYASFIRSACTAWEEKHQTEIKYLMPNLETNASYWSSTVRNSCITGTLTP